MQGVKTHILKRGSSRNWWAKLLCAFLLSMFVSQSVFSERAWATCACTGMGHCADLDCNRAVQEINDQHNDLLNNTEQEFSDDLRAFQDWMIDVMMDTEFAPAMAMTATQMAAVAMYQVEVIGAFLDAENQLDTQLLFQRLEIEAHRDYHPSEELCLFGTVTRSLAASEALARAALAEISISRQLGSANTNAAPSVDQDLAGRWQQFVTTYCDVKDNNWLRADTGLDLACDHDGVAGGPKGGSNLYRRNRDLDYTRMIDVPRTINVDFTNGGNTTDEEDLMALGNNLYGHRVLTRNLSNAQLQNETAQSLFMGLRGVAAKRAVAQDSFNAIVGLKSNGSSNTSSTSQYFAAILKELMPAGTSNEDIYAMMSQKPSYYEQLEILSQKLYQDPDFYASLYDKPANVSRKYVAMKAIELMLDRATYESQLRREMSVSVMLSSKLRQAFRKANSGVASATGQGE